MNRLRALGWMTVIIATVCALTAVQLVVEVWTYKERKDC